MGRIIKGEVAESRERAASIVDEARRKAVALMDEAARARQEMVKEGFAEGLAAGRAEAAALLAEAAVARAQMEALACEDLARVAVVVAGRILGRELRLDPTAVVDVVAEALRAVPRAQEVVVRCHPGDVAALEQGLDRLSFAAGLGRRALRLVGDEGVPAGGAVLESSHGRVDARIETQLATVLAALLD